MEGQEFNSCDNCIYYGYDNEEQNPHVCFNSEGVKPCPDAFTCDDWEDGFPDPDFDRCYECSGYGNDYYVNEDGELVSACDDCPWNGDDDYWDE